MGLGQPEQLSTLSEDIFSCLYATVQLSGSSPALVEILLTLWGIFGTNTQTVFVELFPQIKNHCNAVEGSAYTCTAT